MSIETFYEEFEVHYKDCLDAYFEETRGNCNVSNFGQSMTLSEYMEGHGAGFSMRDSEETIILDKNGVESELRGFHEDVVPESNIYVQEILDTLGPDSDEGGGPFDLECKFTLSDYIMFRGELRGRPFKRWVKDQGGNDLQIKEPNIIEFNYDPVNAIIAAQEIFQQVSQRFDNTRSAVSERFAGLAKMAKEKGLGEEMPRNYLAWAANYLHNRDEPEGFEYHFEAITNSRDDVIDMKQTRQQVDDIGYHEGEQERIKLENRYWDCFKLDENGKWDKELCSEEFTYRKMKKEERELRTQSILDWVKRVPVQNVVDAFGRRGVFHKTLRDSRTVCLTPTGTYRTTFKSPIEVWLTKEQADRCVKAAEEKINQSI